MLNKFEIGKTYRVLDVPSWLGGDYINGELRPEGEDVVFNRHMLDLIGHEFRATREDIYEHTNWYIAPWMCEEVKETKTFQEVIDTIQDGETWESVVDWFKLKSITRKGSLVKLRYEENVFDGETAPLYDNEAKIELYQQFTLKPTTHGYRVYTVSTGLDSELELYRTDTHLEEHDMVTCGDTLSWGRIEEVITKEMTHEEYKNLSVIELV